MYKNIPAIVAILFLGGLILSSGCSVPGFGNSAESSGVSAGLSQVPIHEKPISFSFEEARSQLLYYNASAGEIPVYYMLSQNIDDNGNASSWLFGVHQDNGTVLIIYDRTGWSLNPWNAELPSEEIPLDRITSPTKLFTMNKDIILNATTSSGTVSRTLELQDGIYTLTLKSDTALKKLTFNATTGALIAGHD